MTTAFSITCDRPYLVVEFPEPVATLSWSLTHPGFQLTRRVAWLEVRNADLPEAIDPLAFLSQRMANAGLSDAVALMTSRDIRRHHLARAEWGEVTATCLATVGLSNAVAIGIPQGDAAPAPGTINTLLHVSHALSQAAMIELISVVAQARTAAILALDYRPDGYAVSGTGTDCIVVAAPATGRPADFAGLHTRIGGAAAAAVHAAVTEGGEVWCRERRASASVPIP